MSTKKPCDCCETYVPNLECLSVAGTWAAESGTWSAVTGGATCTSPGSWMFSPSSGLNAGDRQSIRLQIYGSSDWVCGAIIDATDEDNCHRIKLTKSGTSLTAALERVVGGSPTTLDTWDLSATVDGSDTHFNAIVTEYANYVVVHVSAFPSGSLPACESAFPRDASYSKTNGGKLGFFVDSFSGASLTMVRYGYGGSGDGTYGRNLCAPVLPLFCQCDSPGSFASTNIARFGGTDEIYYEIDIPDFALGTNVCDGGTTKDEAFWKTGNINWVGSHHAGHIAEACYYSHANLSCTDPDGYVARKETQLVFPDGNPFAGHEMQEYVADIELSVYWRSWSPSHGISATFRGNIKMNGFEEGEPIVLDDVSVTTVGGTYLPFTGTPTKATLTCV